MKSTAGGLYPHLPPCSGAVHSKRRSFKQFVLAFCDSALDLSVMRVPLAFEIGDQRRAEMAIGLVARVGGKILAEQVERLLADAQRAAICGGADRARTGQPRDDAIERAVHLGRRGDLVANEPTLRAVAIEPALVLDRLPGDAVAGKARHAQIGG